MRDFQRCSEGLRRNVAGAARHPGKTTLSMKFHGGVVRHKDTLIVYSVPSGWRPIVRNLHKSLIYIESRHGLDRLEIHLRSKGGEMIINHHGGSEKTTRAIMRAVGRSKKTCQICGAIFQTEINLRFYELFGEKTFRICDDCIKSKLDSYPSMILFREGKIETIERRIEQACDVLDLYYTYIKISREGYIYIGVSRIDFCEETRHRTYRRKIKCPDRSNFFEIPFERCGVIAFDLTREEAKKQERDAIALVRPDWLINRNRGGSTGPNMYVHVGRIFARIFNFRNDQNIHEMLSLVNSKKISLGETADKLILEAVNEYYKSETRKIQANSIWPRYIFAGKRGYQRRDELKKSMVEFLRKEAPEWISSASII